MIGRSEVIIIVMCLLCLFVQSTSFMSLVRTPSCSLSRSPFYPFFFFFFFPSLFVLFTLLDAVDFVFVFVSLESC